MKLFISNRVGTHIKTEIGESPVTSTSIHETLLTTLHEAVRRAGQQQRTILASMTYPIEWEDTIRVFTGARLAGLGECFFWERHVGTVPGGRLVRHSLIGVGSAATIETNGTTCFTDAAT